MKQPNFTLSQCRMQTSLIHLEPFIPVLFLREGLCTEV